MSRQQIEGAIPTQSHHRFLWIVGGSAFVVALAIVIFQTSRIRPLPPVEPAQGGLVEQDFNRSPLFRDVTAESGLQFTHRNGEEAGHYTILESLGGGVALLDYDGDGLLDVFVTGGGYFDGPNRKTIRGHPCKLYRNLGQWKFQDVTKETGLDITWDYNHGVAVADYDRDGWPDLVVTGYGKLVLFHNEPNDHGGRKFVDVTRQLGLVDNSWSTSAGWADIDGDGYPDLYVCHYVDWSFDNDPVCKALDHKFERDVCPPQQFKPLRHSLFLNLGGHGFRDLAHDLGLKPGCGLGVVLADVNGDGQPDVYVANDATNKFLFFNRGRKILEENGVRAGAALDDVGRPSGSMGVDVGDYDGSGRASLWVANFQSELHGLYKNQGHEIFDYQSRAAGLAGIGMNLVGFGTGFLDVDNDGWEDLVISHGHVLHHSSQGSPLKQLPILLHNVDRSGSGRRVFEDMSTQGGPYFGVPARGRGVAIGDLDNDGWPDLVISHVNSPVVILRNEAAATSPNQWLGVKLVGRDNRDIVGSTVILESDIRKLYRYAKGGGSYLSANDSRIRFGLAPSEQVRKLTVQWSWGKTQTWESLEPRHYWELRESDATPRLLTESSFSINLLKSPTKQHAEGG
jgi:hypothetical protein